MPKVEGFTVIGLEKIDGDIFAIRDDGRRRCIYKSEWRDLTLFFTNDCNSRCIMCPQVADERHGHYLEISQSRNMTLHQGQ